MPTSVRCRSAVLASAWLSAVIAFGGAGLAEEGQPTLYTNEQFIEDVTKQTSLDIEDTKAVLAYVLSKLPDRVRVIPTENYYYFYFYHGGVRYAGNLRFDIGEREKGMVEFIYFKDSTVWSEDETDHHARFGKDDGVTLEKIEDLVYRLSYAGNAVTFELNDLSNVQPKEALGEDEIFLGPVADESGMRFFLVFDESRKLFHYILDQTVAADELIEAENLEHLLVGRRTGFVFLNDPNRNRKILVGVYGPNADVNNYLDGPFDQLPDNFLKGDELRKAILLARPDEDPSIDRLGIRPGGDFRVSIAPYLRYYDFKDLAPVDGCAAKQGAEVYSCIDAAISR